MNNDAKKAATPAESWEQWERVQCGDWYDVSHSDSFYAGFDAGYDHAKSEMQGVRDAAAALVAALTKEPDDYDGLVYYEYSKELAGLQAALSRGWLARKDDPVVIQDDGSGNQVTASGRVLR